MSTKVLLFKNNCRILGSTGAMNIDGRYNIISIKNEIHKRNKRLEKNFPNEVADSFVITDNRYNYNENKILTLD